MIDNAFEIICKKIETALLPQKFSRQPVSNADNNEKAALFTNDAVAYTVVYYFDKQHIVLRNCSIVDEEPDNEWKTIATWMFDPAVDGEKEAISIGNDFAETVAGPVRSKINKTAKKKKKEDEGNADPLFFAKRMVNLFPELKDEIKEEVNGYEPFRGVNFTRTSIVPKVNTLLSHGNKQDIAKLASILSLQYDNGDMDTRSIITIVVLNSIDSGNEGFLKTELSDSLQKAWTASKRMKGKNIKPEKRKEKKKTMMERLGGQQ